MKYLILSLCVLFMFSFEGMAQKGAMKKVPGYKFIVRIKGPKHKRSKVLEIMVDANNNYFAASFRAEKNRFTYIGIYRLYTWEEVGIYKLDVNRAELYCSAFDEEGEFFYVNTDIYKNTFKKINLKNGEIEDVGCSATPTNCKKIEPELYSTEAYTVGDNYYIFRDDNFQNYIRIFVKKELYIPEMEMENGMLGKVNQSKGPLVLSHDQFVEFKEKGVFEKEGIALQYFKSDSLQTASGSTGDTAIGSGSENTRVMISDRDIELLTGQGFIVIDGLKIVVQKKAKKVGSAAKSYNLPANDSLKK